MTASQTDYDALCLGMEASLEDIRQRYKQMARGLHPDKCQLPR